MSLFDEINDEGLDSGGTAFGPQEGFAGVLLLLWDKFALNIEGAALATGACLLAAFSYGISVNYTKKGRKGRRAEPILVQRLAVGVAGFAAGAAGFVWLAEQLGWSVGLPTLVGAVVKDPVQDGVVWQEYLETVMRKRRGWNDLYDACRELS